ncbi:CHASE2 domain-containing protein [Enterovibrio baiacu]|uniref:CHASE2 domain-containing protein n=1 Tax=Enterovibrio baiacu TaxID=2491023 RepID=UPI00101196AD|nr:CHASE2 domain-containing protein [Enterovibrio baiacu]MBE1275027.1 CHASE2 domain-containing protein [Enterovibrio baiacu]
MSIFFKALFTALIILTLFIIDPLGIRVSAEKHYEDHILRLLSPFFSDTVSDEITVVLLDEAFLEQTNTFPVSYTNLARLLKVINQHKPDAVFFDILQHHEHSERLSRWLKALERAKSPVFMASDPEYDTPDRLSQSDSLRRKIADVSSLAAVSWSGEKHYYPMQVESQGRSTPSVAHAMYETYCEKPSIICEHNDAPGNLSSSMIVQWSNTFDPRQNRYLYVGDSCLKQPDSAIGSMFDTLWSLLTQGLRSEQELDDRLRKQCPPLLTLSATSLFAPGASKSPELKEALEGKMVLVGYHLGGGLDTVLSPVHGKLPGVFNHAMALENLILKGGEYWHVPENIGVYNLSIADIIEISIQIIVLFTVIWYRYSHLENGQAHRNPISGIWPVLLIGGLILASVLLSHLSLDLGVANWYALPLILMLDLPIFLYFLLESLKKRMHTMNQRALRNSRVRFRLAKRKVKQKHTIIFKEAK